MINFSASMPAPRRHDRATTALAFVQTALFLVPLIVLGRAIGWPASLAMQPGDLLPLIAREAAAVQTGYWAYLLTALAFIPLALGLGRIAKRQGVDGLLVDTATTFGIAASLMKMLGIVRWLSAMPILADLHGAAADPASRHVVEVAYAALNGYAGAVGELLGVQLLSGLWFVLNAVILTRMGWRALGLAAGLIGVLFLVICLRTVMPQAAALQMIAAPMALVWFPALAMILWRRG